MNSVNKTIIVLLGLFTASGVGYAQRGPGGVSHDTPAPQQSDNRLWLKAGSLTSLADGDNVYLWKDISPSAYPDSATNDISDSFLPPYFRDDPSASINGHPVITFEEGRMLKIKSSTDLNTDATTTYEQTIVLAFRTSEDVTTRQILWEEGGGQRGMNIFIFGGELYLGAYDRIDDTANGSPVPPFGFTYVKTPIQPNTTYVLSHVFYAPTNNTLNGWIKGYRNGNYFGTMNYNGDYAAGVGGVARHPNQIGVGAINDNTYTELGPTGDTGDYPFKGRLGEICYYNRLLNDAERIIVENYLGAKYFASSIANDKYDYQTNYGHDVIGIGQTINSPTQRHTVSQGTNPFEISAKNETTSFNAADEYLLVGHNGGSMNLTTDNTPNDSGSTKRTFRIWRFDETNELLDIKFRFAASDLPPLPVGYSKYVAIFDENSPNFPDFSTNNATVVELEDVGGGYYEFDRDIQSGSFMTIGVIKPQVSFRDPESFAVESDPTPDSTLYTDLIYLRLNYVPSTFVTVDFSFTDGTALRGVDYSYYNSDVANGLTFPPGIQEIPIRVFVINDLILEDSPSIESCQLNLSVGPNTTPGVGIGNQGQHTFSIYDNDPPPKASFSLSTSTVLENAGIHNVEVLRTGSTSGAAHVTVAVQSSTATQGVDFNFAPTTVNFADGESSKTVPITLIDDNIDEPDETILLRFVLPAGGNLGFGGTNLTHTVTIVDDDLPSVAQFVSTNSQNHETFGNPQILVGLDRPSAKEITVYFTKTENLPTAATYGTDYTLGFPGPIHIPAGDSLGIPVTFTVSQDGIDEDDETVEFLLTGADNATLGNDTIHIYTIKDYSAFEWRGAGGVGKDSDNILRVEANRQSGSNNTPFQSLTNFSPHNIELVAPSPSNEALLRTLDPFLNGKQSFKFDNNDVYVIDNSGLVNEANFNRKDMFFAIRTGSDVTTRQTLYKQGINYRGLTVYIQNDTLYLHVLNQVSNPAERWGYDGTPGSARYAYYAGLQPNTDYVVSCHFDKDETKKMRVYVNGVEGQRSETGACGTLQLHGTASLGGVAGSVRYHDGTTNSTGSFKGNLAEFLYFSDAPVNETRRIILENYLGIRYDISLATDNYGDTGTEFNHGVAGIGQVSAATDDLHTDSEGESILRIKSPRVLTDGSFMMWGHNDHPLNESWPWSSGYLPTGIIERSGKVWHVNKTDSVEDVEVLIQYAELLLAQDFNINELKLLVHNNTDPQNFAGATVYNAYALLSGNVVKFTNVDLDNDSYLTLGSSSEVTPLPIELLSFDAAMRTDRVDVFWSTASEQNSDFFSVQRSADINQWKEIARTTGAGQSNQVLDYRETDRDPLPGVSYYRLKQVDFDGAFTYSPVVAVLNTRDSGGDDVFLYPNPVRGSSAFLRLPGYLTEEPVTIRVFDLTGRPVWQGFYRSVMEMTEIPVGDLAAGTYVVQVYSLILNESKKLVVE